ncbi:MAG: hypothetical protein U0401_12695 [Anaerolineae bacterium]
MAVLGHAGQGSGHIIKDSLADGIEARMSMMEWMTITSRSPGMRPK